MGIPTYFRHIESKHPDINFWDSDKVIDYFYFDFNSLIHPQTAEWLKANYEKAMKMSKDEIEDNLIKQVIEYTRFMIDLINPTKEAYIAIDGVVPRAKMQQQRLRRFKRVKDSQLWDALQKEYNEVRPEAWDSSAISPGTEFMGKLSQALQRCIKDRFLVSPQNKSLKVTMSDADEPGEGEHKIMPLIKKLKSEKDNKHSNVCIYGMDADLIILALSAHCSNFYLLRDIQFKEKELNSSDDYLMVSIDKLRTYIIEEMSVPGFNNQGQVDDYIFLSFFMGNDFLPHLPSLNIKEGGLELIRSIYQQVLVTEKRNLVRFVGKVPHVDMDFFRKLVFKLAENEEQRLNTRRNFHFRRPDDGMTPYEKHRWMIERVKLYDRNHPFHEVYKDEINYVNFGAKGWKSRFYRLNFGISKENLEEYNNYRRMISTFWLEGMIWTLKYYYEGIAPSWNWFYPFRKGPFLSDIYNSLHHVGSINDFKFDLGSPMEPYQQLLFILPPQNAKMLEPRYAKLMTDPKSPVIDFYPCDFRLDVDGVELYWKALPVLPLVDGDRLMSAIAEVNRNTKSNKTNKKGKNVKASGDSYNKNTNANSKSSRSTEPKEPKNPKNSNKTKKSPPKSENTKKKTSKSSAVKPKVAPEKPHKTTKVTKKTD